MPPQLLPTYSHMHTHTHTHTHTDKHTYSLPGRQGVQGVIHTTCQQTGRLCFFWCVYVCVWVCVSVLLKSWGQTSKWEGGSQDFCQSVKIRVCVCVCIQARPQPCPCVRFNCGLSKSSKCARYRWFSSLWLHRELLFLFSLGLISPLCFCN